MFGCQYVILAHNFGYLNSSFLHVLGTMSERAAIDLAYKDRETIRNARHVYANTRQWGKKGGGSGISHRIKLSRRPDRDDGGRDDSGRDDGDSDNPDDPPPPRPRPRHAPSAVISPWAISGDYGIGDDQ